MTPRKKSGILKLSYKRGIPVTVCIASIYNNESILGISDRMLTSGSGDIEFEPPAKKVFQLTRCIAVMTAGDSSIQAQLVSGIQAYVNDRVENAPDDWIKVSEVADKYKDLYVELRRKRAEAAILRPHDLTFESFIEKQKTMSEEFVNNISYKLENYRLDDSETVATIVTGIDGSGPHIFVVQNDYVANNDNVGFAAVGIGASHALSQMMLAGMSRYAQESKALLMTHRAKKKSEISPGVGKASDMFVIGNNEPPVPGTFFWLEDIKADIIKDLDTFYDNYVERNQKADGEDEIQVQQYLSELNEQIPTSQQEVPPAPVDATNLTEKPTTSGKVKSNHEKKDSPRRTRRKTN